MYNHISILKSLLGKAHQHSSDKEKPVGAFILFPDGSSAFGCNKTRHGEELSKDKANIVHAEISALSEVSHGKEKGIMYVTKTPCVGCANAIIGSGKVDVLVTPKPYLESRWYDKQVEALEYLQESLTVILVDFDDRNFKEDLIDKSPRSLLHSLGILV